MSNLLANSSPNLLANSGQPYVVTQPLQETHSTAEGQLYFERKVTELAASQQISRHVAILRLVADGVTPEFCTAYLKALQANF